MLTLQQLLGHPVVVVQCHDNPDADTIGAAFALARYFEEKGAATRMVYGGFNQVSKPNLLTFVEALKIPLEFVGKAAASLADLAPGAENPLLITVDCQYGAGNVTKIEAGTVCVIDHHMMEVDLARHTLTKPYLGSCATVVWQLLVAEGFDFSRHPDVATALYYGLYTDTNSLSEIFHPVDRDMLDSLHYDAALIRLLKGNNLTKEELKVASRALSDAGYDESLGTVLYQAEPCDPNILGFISDLTLQVSGVDTCIGFSEINGGVKLSLRSATYEVMANELAAYLTEGHGSGGGNKEKAGGFMRLAGTAVKPVEYLQKRTRDYFTTYDKIVAGKNQPDLASMKHYRKKKLTVGHVKLAGLYPEGTDVTVRTLEGDAVFNVSADTYLMVGVQGETYPIDREKFERSYAVQPGAFAFDPAFTTERFYPPHRDGQPLPPQGGPVAPHRALPAQGRHLHLRRAGQAQHQGVQQVVQRGLYVRQAGGHHRRAGRRPRRYLCDRRPHF